MIEIYNDSDGVIRGIGIEISANCRVNMPKSIWENCKEHELTKQLLSDGILIEKDAEAYNELVWEMEAVKKSIQSFKEQAKTKNAIAEQAESFCEFVAPQIEKVKDMSKGFKLNKKRADAIKELEAEAEPYIKANTTKKASKK